MPLAHESAHGDIRRLPILVQLLSEGSHVFPTEAAAALGVLDAAVALWVNCPSEEATIRFALDTNTTEGAATFSVHCVSSPLPPPPSLATHNNKRSGDAVLLSHIFALPCCAVDDAFDMGSILTNDVVVNIPVPSSSSSPWRLLCLLGALSASVVLKASLPDGCEVRLVFSASTLHHSPMHRPSSSSAVGGGDTIPWTLSRHAACSDAELGPRHTHRSVTISGLFSAIPIRARRAAATVLRQPGGGLSQLSDAHREVITQCVTWCLTQLLRREPNNCYCLLHSVEVHVAAVALPLELRPLNMCPQQQPFAIVTQWLWPVLSFLRHCALYPSAVQTAPTADPPEDLFAVGAAGFRDGDGCSAFDVVSMVRTDSVCQKASDGDTCQIQWLVESEAALACSLTRAALGGERRRVLPLANASMCGCPGSWLPPLFVVLKSDDGSVTAAEADMTDCWRSVLPHTFQRIPIRLHRGDGGEDGGRSTLADVRPLLVMVHEARLQAGVKAPKRVIRRALLEMSWYANVHDARILHHVSSLTIDELLKPFGEERMTGGDVARGTAVTTHDPLLNLSAAKKTNRDGAVSSHASHALRVSTLLQQTGTALPPQPHSSITAKRTFVSLCRDTKQVHATHTAWLRQVLPPLPAQAYLASTQQPSSVRLMKLRLDEAEAECDSDVPLSQSVTSMHRWRRAVAGCHDDLCGVGKDADALQLVGVWDRKFIILAVSDRKSTSSTLPVVVCDFHALHERLRLEYLISHFLNFIASAPLPQPCRIPLCGASLLAVRQSETQLVRLGWRFAVGVCDGEGSGVLDMVGTPLLRMEGFQYAFTTIQALLQTAEELAAHGSKVDDDAVMIPSVFLESLISRSCRGALMVGDALSRNDAVRLLRTAASCVTQFHVCSHGRPSFVVIEQQRHRADVVHTTSPS